MKMKLGHLGNTRRYWTVLFLFGLLASGLVFRAVDLQLLNKDILQYHGQLRSVRTLEVAAHRGAIIDRNGEYLAISTPIQSIWCRPRELLESQTRWSSVAGEVSIALGMRPGDLQQRLEDRSKQNFAYLKRHADPDLVEKIASLNIPGIYLQKEYRRYYPAGEVTAHVLGFTNVDDLGQEGLELVYNGWLQGRPGKRRVLRDRLGRVVEHIADIEDAEPGRELVLGMDLRIQYLAYRELKAAVGQHNANGGALIVLDVRTGEVLAMVSQPAYNPNNRRVLKSAHYRNRAVTDIFEPGSTLKPFVIVAALSSGRYQPDTLVDTHPGSLKVGGHTIRDSRNYGLLDLARVVTKSSNVGASKIALSLEPVALWQQLSDFGFGRSTSSVYPGEASGSLPIYKDWSEVERATLAFGYGMSVSALQLIQAYGVIAADGVLRPVSFTRVEEVPGEQQIILPEIAGQVRTIMEGVVSIEGTGRLAAVPGYHISGKTGTVRKSESGGYSSEQYLSLFIGMAPASQPRLAAIIVVDEPKGEQYYGGQVAAPVFSKVMAGALRIMNIPPDDLSIFAKSFISHL